MKSLSETRGFFFVVYLLLLEQYLSIQNLFLSILQTIFFERKKIVFLTAESYSEFL